MGVSTRLEKSLYNGNTLSMGGVKQRCPTVTVTGINGRPEPQRFLYETDVSSRRRPHQKRLPLSVSSVRVNASFQKGTCDVIVSAGDRYPECLADRGRIYLGLGTGQQSHQSIGVLMVEGVIQGLSEPHRFTRLIALVVA